MVPLRYSEDLQETLLGLDRALQQEKRARRENEAILQGLESLVGAKTREDVFGALADAFRRIVHCRDCWVMRRHGRKLVSEMTEVRFAIGKAFARVLAGRTLNAFDVGRIPEWRSRRVAHVQSAMHLPLSISGEPGMLVITSEQRAAFSRDDVELARRIIPFAEQAMEKIHMLERAHARELDEQRRLMKMILDHAPIGVLMLDREQRAIFVNRFFCEMTGVTAKAFLAARHYTEALPEAIARQCEESNERCLAEGRMIRAQEAIPDAEGRERVFDVIKVPLRDARRSITGLLGIFVDVTEKLALEAEREQMQKQLLHTQKLESLGVLAGGIAHDFNNILAAIMGHAAMAEKKSLRDPLAVRRHLEAIIKSSETAADLCKQMLAYSGRGKFVVKPVNLSELIASIVNILEVSLNKGVVLKLSLMEQLPEVEADPSQIQQVIMNLITNANEAIGNRSGVISIRTGVMKVDSDYLAQCLGAEEVDPGDFVFMVVADTGCGMSSETKEKMFDPFFTTKFTGRGLGMSAVLGIVRGHHGALRIYSELGQGTTVRILLPAMAGAKVSDLGDADLSLQGEGPLPAVLVVDDEASIRDMAAMMLKDIGFTDIYTASDGEEALRVYQRERENIGLILLDLTMPHMDGEETYRRLRLIDPGVRVILSSGYTENDIEDRFAGKGLCGFLQKPYMPERLRRAVARALNLPRRKA